MDELNACAAQAFHQRVHGQRCAHTLVPFILLFQHHKRLAIHNAPRPAVGGLAQRRPQIHVIQLRVTFNIRRQREFPGGPCLQSHAPLDGVILMLGTNDLKRRFGLPATDIALGVKALVGVIQHSRSGRGNVAPPVLLLAPPPLAPLREGMVLAEMFEGGEIKSQQFAALYARTAQEMGCAFFDISTVIRSSPIDGIHFEAVEHAKLGASLVGPLRDAI